MKKKRLFNDFSHKEIGLKTSLEQTMRIFILPSEVYAVELLIEQQSSLPNREERFRCNRNFQSIGEQSIT